MRKLKTLELERLSTDEFKAASKTPIVLILDNVRSGLNVGSAFRTADAFALQSILLCGITATPPHREILKTAIGASATVAWTYFEKVEDAVARCKQAGMSVFAIEQTDASLPLDEFVLPENKNGYALVFGNEVNGVSDEILSEIDGAIEIRQFGTKHSLNVSVSLGILVWEFWRQRSGEKK
ncbi:MAG TPA: TrmH family RNA methyltransferase [Saprospiraceae bacterium]|nr:TrmH family RNA methyltransferase [Saprospiraceae bacterium]